MPQALLTAAGESFATQQKPAQQALLNITEAKSLCFLLEIKEKYDLDTQKDIGFAQQDDKE